MPDSSLPGDVRATIGRRVELLADDTRRMLAAASVLGRRFDVAPLAATTVKLDRRRRHGGARGGGRGRGRRRRRRRPLHVRPRTHRGHALRRASPGPPGAPAPGRGRGDASDLEPTIRRCAAIAYHYCRALPAGDRARAVDYARRAGDDGGERGAPEQAIQHFERAREAAVGGERRNPRRGRSGRRCCATWATRTTSAGQTEAAQADLREADRTRRRRQRHDRPRPVGARPDGRGRRSRSAST